MGATFDVEHFIALDRQSIRIQLGIAAAIVVLGLFGIFGLFAKLATSGSGDFDTISKGVGLVVTLVGLFPANNCWTRWERIKTLRAIQLHPEMLDAATEQEFVRKLYAKFLGV